MNDVPRIKYYDGLRGIAALWVAIIHFFATFHWPGIISGNISAYDLLKRILLNGDLCVFTFWLLSGVVISHGLIQSQQSVLNKVAEFPVKRYLRLVLPVFFCSLFCFILLKFDGFLIDEIIKSPTYHGNTKWVSQFYNFSPEFVSFLKITFFDVFLIGNSNYDAPLWTIGPELFGPILIVMLLFIYRNNANKLINYSIWLLFFFIGGMSHYNFYHYILFIVGLLITEISFTEIITGRIGITKVLEILFNTKTAAYLFLIVSILLEYFFQDNIPHTLKFFTLPLRALSLLLIIKNTLFLQKLLSHQFFQFFGKISFALYLIHLPAILSVISFIYLQNAIYFSSHILILLLIFISIVVFLSYFFYKIFEVRSVAFAKKFSSKLVTATTN